MNGIQFWTNVVMGAGHRSLRAWALANRFKYHTVYTCVARWGMRDDRPLGGISRQIMAKLRKLQRANA